jgi:nitric oxide reductase NorE protein
MAAVTASTAEVTPNHGTHVPGEAGIWLLLFGDLSVFAVLFMVYLRRRGQNRELFAQSQEALNRSFGALNTIVLLTSSLLVVFGLRAFRSDRWRHLTARLTLTGATVGTLFVVIKIVEYRQKIALNVTPSTNEFFMYYYVMTGLHLVHVVVGLGVLLVLSAVARNPAPTRTQIAFYEGGACFWHMVDLLWVVIFPLVFLVR